MKNSTTIVFFLFIATTLNFHIIVEDSDSQRKGTIYGNIKIIHHDRDNKPALIILRPYLIHSNGEPPLTLSDIDIIHLLQDGLYRFEPEIMQQQIEKNTHYLQLLKYKSKKSPKWTYRFYFQSELLQLMKEIKYFVDLHQLQPHVDIFQNLPHDMKEQLLNEHLESINAFHQISKSDQL